MQKIPSVLQQQSFSVNFSAVVPTPAGKDAGAIGTYTTPITLPFGAYIYAVFLNVVTAFTNGGGGTVALGVTGFPISLMIATDLSALSPPLLQTVGGAVAGSVTGIIPSTPVSGLPVILTIATAAYTAGAGTFVIQYSTNCDD